MTTTLLVVALWWHLQSGGPCLPLPVELLAASFPLDVDSARWCSRGGVDLEPAMFLPLVLPLRPWSLAALSALWHHPCSFSFDGWVPRPLLRRSAFGPKEARSRLWAHDSLVVLLSTAPGWVCIDRRLLAGQHSGAEGCRLLWGQVLGRVRLEVRSHQFRTALEHHQVPWGLPLFSVHGLRLGVCSGEPPRCRPPRTHGQVPRVDC